MTTYHPDATGECTHCDEPIDGHVCPTHDSPCAIEGACQFTALEKDRSAAVVALETAQARVQELERDAERERAARRIVDAALRQTIQQSEDNFNGWAAEKGRSMELERDQQMLATVIRNTVLALADVPDDWEGSVDEGVSLINANVEKVNRHVEELEREVARIQEYAAPYIPGGDEHERTATEIRTLDTMNAQLDEQNKVLAARLQELERFERAFDQSEQMRAALLTRAQELEREVARLQQRIALGPHR